MRWVLWCTVGAILLVGGKTLAAEHPPPHAVEVPLYGTTFKVSGFKFTIPYKWVIEPVENENRAGQWHVPPPRGVVSENGEVVVFYFGPGIGGTAHENIEAWTNTVLTSDGHPEPGKVTNIVVNGTKITEVALYGIYNQASPAPGLPPLVKPNYGLLGAVIESPQGNIYWRFTGPEALISADQPLFDRIIASIKPQDRLKP